jgi:hypothetical protein
MKSIKTNSNSAKGPDIGKIVNKLYCILHQFSLVPDNQTNVNVEACFMSVFFEKNIIKPTQVLSIICNTICLQYSFAELGFVFNDFCQYSMFYTNKMF